jgi:hypothetical protein
MMMFLIADMLKTTKNLKVMIATPVPSETIHQYKESFEHILDKNKIDIMLSSEYKTNDNIIQNEKALLLITSIQLLKKYN